MAKTRIGLDVGSTAVRVAELTIGSPPSVIRAGQVALPRGAVELGEVHQGEAVTEAIRELWSSVGVKGKHVHLGVGNHRVIVREVTLPWLPEKELRESLAFQVQEFIPIAADEAVLDFDLLSEKDQNGRRMQSILLVAAHKGMVNALVESVVAAKLDPVGVDLTPFAVVRAIGTGDEGLDLEPEAVGDEALIDIGAHVTTVCVHERGTIRFVRILPSGGRDVTIAISRGLGIDEDVAEALKRGDPIETPMNEDGRPVTLPDPAEVRQLAITRAGSFADEVRSSLEFYAAQIPGARISRVVVTGGGSLLEGFIELMQERIPVPVSRGKLFEHARSQLNLDADALDQVESVLSVAAGLAMTDRGSS